MKSFECLVLDHLKSVTGPLLDPLQFAYRANRSADDAVNMGLDFILEHLDSAGTYVRILFVDFSSAFNTIIPELLSSKLLQLSVSPAICQWIYSFLTGKTQQVRLGETTSSTRSISTGAPQGCVLSPLLFSLYMNDCTSTHPAVKLLKFADDTTVIGLIKDGDESAYRQEVERLELWCGRHNLELNTLKTVEMIVDFRRHPLPQLPLTLSSCLVSTIETFKFLGITVSQDLKWATNINSVLKKAQQRMYFLRLLRKHGLSPELLRQLDTAVIESVLCSSITVWFGAATKNNKLRLQRTIKTAEKIVGTPLPTLEDLHAARSKTRACKILSDAPHPGHRLFQLLPSALQEHCNTEQPTTGLSHGDQNATSQTDRSAGANGVCDVSGKGEEPATEGARENGQQSEAQLKQTQLHGLSEKSVEEIVAKHSALGWSAALCPITHCFGAELEVALNTQHEEKRLLREQLRHLEVTKQAELSKLQDELSKMSDKLKKKQESFQRLHAEKEVLYNDSRTKIEEINQRKEEELKLMNTRIHKFQLDLTAASQVTMELREKLETSDKDHQLALYALKDQIQTSKMQEVNLLREQQEAQAAELQQSRAQQEKLLAQRDDLDSQLQESSFANRKLLEQLTEEGQEKEKLLREFEESKKTAEKRKAMLDDMAIQLNQEKSNHKEALSDLRLQHEKEVLGVRARYEKELRGLHEEKTRSEEDIRQQLRDEKARSKELESLQTKVQELHSQLQSLEETKAWFERRLNEAKENTDKLTLEHQEAVKTLHEQHTLDLQAKQAEVEVVHGQLVDVQNQRDEHHSTIVKLKQEIKDTMDGQRILEKKGSAALKDLKRQLQLERKRADKLQERLQEILTNSKSRTGLEELVLSEINSPSRTQQTGDSSSVSSFSYRDMMKECQSGGQNKSGGGSPQCQRAAELSDDELGELFQRLAEVQQEKWMLEEKVKHLEVSCSSMAEDICRKSAIIETYVMESRRDVSGGATGSHGGASQADRGGLGSVLRDLVKSGDENVREMNKKLQNMLEEQLTKNMHLHKDLEVLSQELVRLSKEPAPDGSSAGSG
ncbi:GRIP1-associated protein 1 isoform X3 [Phyllopteryx taeniolatus]|uniref:GRIP1-associated protein 1 isoform X3 n=1 Tax=Phyllopteryx taeniolatus TaxID=161469 RepID=UPI002AD31A4C|nr:GRIP1-associated protein 1 isoform X3 [Phyllopteryx taeniolatus]